ncbi:MAG: hypothetical protein QOD83_2504 [Solirubrobacteraceae bacterium]|nr:hypothetical protein [Solirubrobacteraceae bacterium]
MPESDDDLATKLKDKAVRKALTAVLALVFAAMTLVLPPVANSQLAYAEKTLQKPLMAAVVAIAIVALSAWKLRFAVGLAVAVCLASLLHIAYFVVTTEPGRSAAHSARGWRSVPLASAAHGVAENHPNVFGQARLNWSGDRLRLDLRSATGTTQQGFLLDGGALSARFYFQARVEKINGGQAVICPLLFGIKDIRNYFTFRLQSRPDGSVIAVAYQIIANSPVFTSGFHGVLLDETKPLPYVNTWNIVTPSERTKTKLAIVADGNYYRFFVNDREVFARQIDGVPTHTVAVGVTVLANALRADAVCQTDRVELRVADTSGSA